MYYIVIHRPIINNNKDLIFSLDLDFAGGKNQRHDERIIIL